MKSHQLIIKLLTNSNKCCFANDGTGKRGKQRKHRAQNVKIPNTIFSDDNIISPKTNDTDLPLQLMGIQELITLKQFTQSRYKNFSLHSFSFPFLSTFSLLVDVKQKFCRERSVTHQSVISHQCGLLRLQPNFSPPGGPKGCTSFSMVLRGQRITPCRKKALI